MLKILFTNVHFSFFHSAFFPLIISANAYKVVDELTLNQIIVAPAKLKHFDFAPPSTFTNMLSNNAPQLQLLTTLNNNKLVFYNITTTVDANHPEVKYDQWNALELPGHRSEIRDVALASDDTMLLTASSSTFAQITSVPLSFTSCFFFRFHSLPTLLFPSFSLFYLDYTN